ncbi:patatin-like phospholipase domain-containing protein 4 [Strongylocentrotus purpuratus]|uniref:PNPLA domain-containing protein n=1 Tax=Strongylocentrotus purpuratus TaxID=7668 RepID=A0A7M7P2Y9_STRPU|nr:patatin-like phospholipase domain-containing protein 4 [Strongylocentrotus purpuratus]|eukprot:XP_011667133.1 PREDICTED: patatin-like phospholipase domain-containing protein 4 isoform X2 [Strongylocentrotus purpuratus]
MTSHVSPPFNLSFTEASFFGLSNLGVAQCLLDHGTVVLSQMQAIGGSSSSAIIAAIIATAPEKLADLLYGLYDIVDEMSPLPNGAITPGFDFIGRLRVLLDRLLPMTAHQLASHKLFIKATELRLVDKYDALTVHDVDQGTSSCVRSKGPKVFEVGDRAWSLGAEVQISSYGSREELIEVILGSVFVPWFTTWTPPSCNGKFFGDVTLSRKENLSGDVTFQFPPGSLIKISPSPKNRLNMRDKIACGWVDTTGQRFDISALQMYRIGDGLYPPPKAYLETYFADGYEDATRFLKFYHIYEENGRGYGPRQDSYASIHFVEDLR